MALERSLARALTPWPEHFPPDDFARQPRQFPSDQNQPAFRFGLFHQLARGRNHKKLFFKNPSKRKIEKSLYPAIGLCYYLPNKTNDSPRSRPALAQVAASLEAPFGGSGPLP
jgi:hypothetical protein